MELNLAASYQSVYLLGHNPLVLTNVMKSSPVCVYSCHLEVTSDGPEKLEAVWSGVHQAGLRVVLCNTSVLTNFPNQIGGLLISPERVTSLTGYDPLSSLCHCGICDDVGLARLPRGPQPSDGECWILEALGAALELSSKAGGVTCTGSPERSSVLASEFGGV